jgi:3-oxoacyl-[acyl-carrier-protein] synthase III
VIPARILGTGSLLPGRTVSNEDLARALPGRSAADIGARTGLEQRRWVEPGTRSATLGAEALRRALEAARLEARALRRVIFVSTAGGDTLIPANANRVAHALGIDGEADAFDLNNACLGFLTALDLAARSAATGLAPVAIVVVEIFSDLVSPEDPRPYLVAGDAAAAVIVGPGREGEGIRGISLRNKGSLGGTVTMPHPRFSKAFERVTFTAGNRQMGEMAIALLRASVASALAESGDRLEDMNWVLPHQPNGVMFEAILAALAVSPDKTVPIVHEVGTTGAAAIPVSLDRLMRTRAVSPGDRILMASVGTGVSYGAMIYQTGPVSPH